MRVHIVSAVFPPEPVVSAQTSAQIAEELAKRGHTVRVFAPFPNRPKGKLYDGYRRTLYATSTSDDGYTLTHCFSTLAPRSTMLSRFSENLSFGIAVGLRLLCEERPDVIYSNSWAIFATGIVAVVAKMRDIPLVLSVQDIYPESMLSQERVSGGGIVFRALRWLDTQIARSASEINLISDGFRKHYETQRKISPQHLHVIPNWGNEEALQEDSDAANAFRAKLRIPAGAFVAVFAGNIGMAANAEMLPAVFALLAAHQNIYLVIAGDGARLNACIERASKLRLSRVLFHSPWKKEETGAVLQMADVLLLPTKGDQSLNSIPSKLIAYLLSRRPVIAAVLEGSDTAMAINASKAGWVVEPGAVQQMAETIAVASNLSKELLQRMGASGCSYASQHFTRTANLSRVISIVEEASGLCENGPATRRGVFPC